jgi:hypothetical protein
MKPSLPSMLVLCWFGLAGCLNSHADDATGGLIDQACQSADDCAAPAAECSDYAGTKRCISECAKSADCGRSISYVGQTTITTEVEYSNGRVVRCSGTSASGDCSDDSGATCQW